MFIRRGLAAPGSVFLEDRPALVSALAHGPGQTRFEAPDDPHGSIGAFAQKHYYREMAVRLLGLAEELALLLGCGRKAIRVFCNSRLPEKALAVAAGLGRPGRHSLVLLPRSGSWQVLGGLLLPPRSLALPKTYDGRPSELAPECAGCDECVRACPVGAIKAEGGCRSERCLQGRAGRAEILNEDLAAAWGGFVYGCDLCQVACPANHAPPPAADTRLGVLGPGLSLRLLLRASDDELEGLLKGTALGFAWIDRTALRRNALLAASARGLARFRPEAEKLLGHGSPVLRWAAGRYLLGPAALT